MGFIVIGMFCIGVGLAMFWLRKDDPRYVVHGHLIQYRLFGILLILIGLFAVLIGGGMRSFLGIPVHPR